MFSKKLKVCSRFTAGERNQHNILKPDAGSGARYSVLLGHTHPALHDHDRVQIYPRPNNGVDWNVWDGRAAMLDAIFHMTYEMN